MADWKNKLYYGDNLSILRDYISDQSVDLVYLDPPFNSSVNYNVLFQEKSGEKSAAQMTAFEDTWHWGSESQETYHEIVTTGPRKIAELIQALRSFLGTNDMMAYLTMMAPRLVELHRTLKATGSLYLHCDPTASHYLKIVLDAIFGPENYRNEIIWKRADTVKGNFGQGSKRWDGNTDTILFYRKTDGNIFNSQFAPYTEEYINDFYKHVEPNTGRRYQLISMTGPGGVAKGNPEYEVLGVTRSWRYSRQKMQELIDTGMVVQTSPGAVPRRKQYLDMGKGVPVQTLWDDISGLHSQAAERLGYPTQKPEPLLERIIKAGSNEGDIVLDPFCGCGTTINVAERLKRKWIGIDITHLAIGLIKHRLNDTFGNELAPYEVIGEPKDLESAKALALQGLDGRYQFQYWAIGLLLVAQYSQDKKKGADSGIDGVINFIDDESGKYKKIIVQVKSGHVKATDIRDLVGVLAREKAEIGVYITLEEPTKPMKVEALSAGFYEPVFLQGQKFPRIQILTIEELLDGKELQYPRLNVATFKKAERKTKANQQQLF